MGQGSQQGGFVRRPESKVFDRAAMRAERFRLKTEAKTVAFTNGCFDILHVGHLELLTFARSQGDVLIVGLNSDVSVRQFKGPDRPIVPQEERARLLAAMEAVDYVVLFDEPRVDALVAELVPDVLVKGADWAHEVHGREIVEAAGGRVVLAPVVRGHSTTNIIGTILRTYGSHTRG